MKYTLRLQMLRNTHHSQGTSVNFFSHLNIALLFVSGFSQGGNKHSHQASFFQENELRQHRCQRSGTMTMNYSFHTEHTVLLQHHLVFSPVSARPDSDCWSHSFHTIQEFLFKICSVIEYPRLCQLVVAVK